VGISRGDLEILIHLREQGHLPLNSYVAEIGAQQLSNSFLRSTDLIRKAAAAFGAVSSFSTSPPSHSTLSAEGRELQSSDAPFARDFWISLGFEYTAIDVDGSLGSIPLDLNFDTVPEGMLHKYGLVTNLGTTEHVCNQLNAFKIIHDLAAPGAVMIHHLPAGGMLDHGLINYTPKFFWYLARSNEYKWLYTSFRGGKHHYPIPKYLLDFTESYDPASSKDLQSCEISDYALLVVLQKTLDIPFVAPLDVNTGTRTNNANLNRRYWTVLQPTVLESVLRGEKIPEWISYPLSRAADNER
jgi:hypothetical protein